jgi:general secretion pathway protein L
MTTYLFIYWADPTSSDIAWRRVGEQGATPVMHGHLSQVAEQTSGAKVVVLVPSRYILTTKIKVPTTNRKRLLQAIPYAIEDQLIADPEDQHFALGDIDADGDLSLAIVQRDTLDKWLNTLKENQLYPDMVLPDIYALPEEAQSWHIAANADTLILRTGSQQGMQCPTMQLPLVLPLLQRDLEMMPERVVVHAEGNVLAVENSFSMLDEAPEVETQVVDADVVLTCVSNVAFEPKTVINLLQGDYSRREQLGKYWRPWKLAASLAAIWFVVNVVMMAVSNVQLGNVEKDLREQAKAIYKQAVPEARNIPKPVKQMKDLLAKLGGGNVGDDQFMLLLSRSAEALKTTQGLLLQSIRFKSGVLDIEMEVPGLQVLDQLKQKITSAHPDLQVDIQSAKSRDNSVQGRVQVKVKK